PSWRRAPRLTACSRRPRPRARSGTSRPRARPSRWHWRRTWVPRRRRRSTYSNSPEGPDARRASGAGPRNRRGARGGDRTGTEEPSVAQQKNQPAKPEVAAFQAEEDRELAAADAEYRASLDVSPEALATASPTDWATTALLGQTTKALTSLVGTPGAGPTPQ